MNELMEKKQKVVAVIKERCGLISALIYIALIAVAVIAVQRAWNYGALEKEKEALQVSLSKAEDELGKLAETQEQLAYSEKEVKLLKESTNALKEQVSSLNVEKEELNNKLEELLNVEETVPVITRVELEDQISSLSELVTKKYWYRNSSETKDGKKWIAGWTMPFSETSLLATYDGTITASIDIKEIKFDVNQSTKVITITMPKSKIFDHNIPQETINVLQHKDNLFNKVTFNDYNKFISAEKDVMEQQAIDRGLLIEADNEAKEIVKAFLGTLPGIERYKLIFK